MKIENKREKEKEIVTLMIRLYCRSNHKESELCSDCKELLDYALERIDKCPNMETKTFCSSCKVHCYKKDRQEKIREVMRFSGPRMLFHHPVMTLKHMFIKRK